MYYQPTLSFPSLRFYLREQVLAILIIASLLLQPLATLLPPTVVRNAERETQSVTTTAGPATPSPLAPRSSPHLRLALPTALVGKPEVAALRTVDSATFDLGDGQFARYQDTQPLHYQDDNGDWQPIDPTFAQTPIGWVNATNIIRTAIDQQSSAAIIGDEQVGVRWQPVGLELITSGEPARAVATPLAAGAAMGALQAQGDIVRFANHWSMTTLQDQWQSKAGSVEYTMRLTELPDVGWWQTTPTALDLRVELTLRPGTTLLVHGKPVDLTAPLATRHPLTFVSADGREMILQPPTTYEQHNRENAVAASYVLRTTGDPNVIELSVRTPWQWLAAPERQFPVIIDPIFQMRAPFLAAEAIYTPSTPGAPYTFDHTHYISDRIYLGRNTANAYRAALRFDLPLMPPGTQIDRAWLYAVPSNYKRVSANFNVDLGGLLGEISAYAIQNDSWINGGEPTVNLNDPISPSPQLISYSAGQTEHRGVMWDVTSLAQSWLPIYNGLPPNNLGILLRLKNEFCNPDGIIFLPETLFCGGFEFDLALDSWSEHPDLENSQVNGSPDNPALLPSETGGIRLVVFYSNNQTLIEGSPITILQSGNKLPQGMAKNPPYYWADHLYKVAKPPAKWQALVARGFGTPTGVNPPSQPGAQNAYKVPLQGSVPLKLRSSNDSFEVASVTAGSGEAGYLLLNGRGTATPITDQNLPLRVTFSPDANQPLASTIGYDLRLIGEQPTPLNPTLGVVKEINYTFDSADPLALWNLVLPTNSTSRIRIQVTQDGTRPKTYANLYAKDFEAKVVRSTSQLPINTSAFDDMTEGKAWTLAADMAKSSSFIYQQSGQYALAIRYNGPQLVVRDVEECGKEFCDTTTVPIKYNLNIKVLACPAGTFPTNGGECQQVKCPNTTDFVADTTHYREISNFGLWSAAGWSGDNETVPVASIKSTVAPLLGPPKNLIQQYRAPKVVVLGGKITYDKPNSTVTVASATLPTEPPTAMLVECPDPTSASGQFIKVFEVFDGNLKNIMSNAVPVLSADPAGSGQLFADPWPNTDRQSDLTQNTFTIDHRAGTANGSAKVRRVVGMGPTENLFFNASWSFDVNGWPSLTSDISETPGNLNPPDLASLHIYLSDQLSLDTTAANGNLPRIFTAIRDQATTIQQQLKLGNAARVVQSVILPRNIAIPVIDVFCPGSCLDLRGPTDAANLSIPDRQWEMPDIHTNVDAKTMMMSAAGVMEVYSTDHPTIDAATADAFSKEFSFDAFKAKVTIDHTQCGGTGPQVLVITGETSMALPNIGTPGITGQVAATFTLCETSLRGVHMSFDSPIGIPLGNSGLFLTGLNGGVDIYPDYTRIELGLNFQAAPGGNGGAFRATGGVVLDTRGLFEFQGSGEVLGTVNVDGRIWVAWNPLDTGFEVDIAVGDWLRGFARAHLWVGQGWQNRYHWLPDNDEKHFAGEIGATLIIRESAIMWLVPPGDISFGIELAFGQFCTNSSCTTYEWGIKGKFVVSGFDIGLYYGFDKGLDFILGNDGHLLIDEYGGGVYAASANSIQVQMGPAKVNGTVTIPFTVSPRAEQILIGISWQAGAPQLSLINPDGVEINIGNVSAHNGATDGNSNVTLLGLQTPKTGQWQARLSNLSEAGVEHYRFIYFANKGAPGTPGNRGHFVNPANGQNVDGANGYTIQWEAPADTPDTATVSLSYYRTEVITGNLQLGVPIVRNLPFKAGQYQWDTGGLLNGSYLIRAEVDDGVNALPLDQISQPDDVCLPQTNGLPTVRAFDANRFPGTVVFTSTGTIAINDVAPPVTPTGLQLYPMDGAIMARWNMAPEKDVNSYLVRWGPRSQGNPNAFVVHNQALVVATGKPEYRIGAVSNGVDYGVDLIALDVNGNASPQSAPLFATPGTGGNQIPSTPLTPTLATRTVDSITVNWLPGPGNAPATYRVEYTRLDASSAQAMLDVTGPNATISGLETGVSYLVRVAAGNSDGWYSAYSPAIRVLVTSGVDGNGDGMADDWAAKFGVSDASADTDGDGLTNAAEYNAGANPLVQDTDGDDYSDGEELVAGADPVNGSSYGAVFTQARLALSTDRLLFTTKKQPGGEAAPKNITWGNVAGGALALQAGSDANWINASVAGDQVQVGIDHSNLAPGFHSGVIRLTAAPGTGPIIGGPNCIRVNAWVLAADDDTSPQPNLTGRLYLPLIHR